MKYAITLLFLIRNCLFTSNAGAQYMHKGESEVQVSFGIASFDQIYTIANGSRSLGLTGFTGADFITYRYFCTNRLAIGVSVGLDKLEGIYDYKGYYSSTFPYANQPVSSSAYTIAPELTVIYNSGERVRVYGSVGLGYTLAHDFSGESSSHINGQLVGLGIRSNRTLSPFLELGFGYKGILNFGVSVNFGEKQGIHSRRWKSY